MWHLQYALLCMCISSISHGCPQCVGTIEPESSPFFDKALYQSTHARTTKAYTPAPAQKLQSSPASKTTHLEKKGKT